MYQQDGLRFLGILVLAMSLTVIWVFQIASVYNRLPLFDGFTLLAVIMGVAVIWLWIKVAGLGGKDPK